jgi:large subunit ribosomal protein L13
MKTWTGSGPSDEAVTRNWWIVDATGKSVGRVASEVAKVIRGKHKPQFSRNADHGDFVVVVNAEKATLSGNKWQTKKFYRHSRFFGGLRELTAAQVLEKEPSFIIEDAVKGMLPRGPLGYHLITKLKAYAGPNHPHTAQKPMALEVKG